MKDIGSRPRLVVSADGSGVVGHAGSRLLADLAEATGLTAAYSTVLRQLRPRGTGHDPGRIAADLAVMLADGGEAIADPAVLRDQREVFGPVASTPTAWRLLAAVDERILDRLRLARAAAREVAWLQAAETRTAIPAVKAGGRELPGLVLDLDATLVTCHSEKDQAAPTYKSGFGFHPLLCFPRPTCLATGSPTKAGHVSRRARLKTAVGWSMSRTISPPAGGSMCSSKPKTSAASASASPDTKRCRNRCRRPVLGFSGLGAGAIH